MQYLGNAGSYLADTLLGFYLYIILIRFWMQWVHADFRNPLGQFIITVTNPVVVPLRRLLPSIGAIDTATVVFAFAIALLKIVILVSLLGANPEWLKLAMYAFGEIIRCSVYIFMFAIFINIILSWVSPHSYHPVLGVVNSLSEPILAQARKIIPPMGGLDFSPILVIIFLQLTLILVVAPIQNI